MQMSDTPKTTRQIDDHATELTAEGRRQVQQAQDNHAKMGLRDDTTADSAAEMAAIDARIDAAAAAEGTRTETVELTVAQIIAHDIRNRRLAARWVEDNDDAGTEIFEVTPELAAEIAAA